MAHLPFLPGYLAIKKFYGDRCAQRSGVQLINHIDQGLKIMLARDATLSAMDAYCLHPLYQNDVDLSTEGKMHAAFCNSAYTVMLAMEYRNIANQYLARVNMPTGGIKLSPLQEVNEMLIADKVQNRKDFELYHKGVHANSDRLDAYFKEWLQALNVSEDQYQEYVKLIS